MKKSRKGFDACRMALAGLLLSALLVSGCSAPRELVRVEMPETPVALSDEYRAIYRDVAQGSPAVRTMDGYADLRVVFANQDHRLYASISVDRAGEARLILSAGIIGLPVADVLVGRETVYVHDMLNGLYFIGRSNDRNLEKLLGFGAGWQLFSGALTGLVEVSEPVGAIREVRSGPGLLSFVVASGEGTKELVVDPEDRTLRALVLREGNGHKTAEMHFSRFVAHKVEGEEVLVPSGIEMVAYGAETIQSRKVSIRYDECAFNDGHKPAGFSIPLDAKIYSLDDIDSFPWM